MADDPHVPHVPRALPVPQSRLGRATRMGGLTAGILGRAATTGLRTIATGTRPNPRDLFLTPTNARRITAELARMRGAAMKVGQLLSMESADLISPEMAALLAPLQADAHFMPPKALDQVLRAQWGDGYRSHFKRFDPRPIAAASIGQVHRAQTHDGRDLAIKVQYPGVAAAIDSDIANLKLMLRLPGVVPTDLDLAPLMEDARVQLHEEADYTREAAMQMRFHAALTPDFIVPKVHADLSTPQILAMDFIPSIPLSQAQALPQATRDHIAQSLTALALCELFDLRLMQTDPNLANFRYDPETDKIVLLDFGATRAFDADFSDRHRALLHAARSGDRVQSDALLTQIGYFRADMDMNLRAELLDIFEIAMAPVTKGGLHDFATCTLVETLRAKGFDMASERTVAPVPPASALFLQRKIGGLYLMAKRLGARIDMDALVAPY